jgi:hypothetical protein
MIRSHRLLVRILAIVAGVGAVGIGAHLAIRAIIAMHAG